MSNTVAIGPEARTTLLTPSTHFYAEADITGQFYGDYKTAAEDLVAVTDAHAGAVTDEIQSGEWPNDEAIALRAAKLQAASKAVVEVLARNEEHYQRNNESYILEARREAAAEGVEISPPLPPVPSVFEMRQYFMNRDRAQFGPRRAGFYKGY